MRSTLILRFVFLLAFIAFVRHSLCAKQDIIDNPDSLKAYLVKKQFAIDSNASAASAVILYENGRSKLTGRVMVYEVEGTIKILSKEAADEVGRLVLPASGIAKVKEVSGVTYNMEHGKVTFQKVSPSDIITHKVNKYRSILKFQLPSLKVGSILHYSFKIQFYPTLSIPAWNFQHEYPVLYSRYEVIIPDGYAYRNILRSYNSFTQSDNIKSVDSMNAGFYQGSPWDGEINFIWVRHNIPALNTEPFMLSGEHYAEQIKVQITETLGNIMLRSWDQVSRSLVKNNQSEMFFRIFQANGFLNQKVKLLTAGKSTELERAKAIFSYVRDSFLLGDSHPEMNLKVVFKSHRGSVQELNLLLTAMLKKARLNSDPVILSLKPGEPLSSIYPNPYHADYTISKVNISGKDYFLDASRKYLSFGLLTPECYNGYSRVIGQKTYPVILDPNQLTDENTILASLSFDTSGAPGMILKLDEKLGLISGWKDRKRWKNDISAARKALRAQFNNEDFELQDVSIDNLSEPDKPLVIHFIATAPMKNDLRLIYVSPYLYKGFSENPFQDEHRKFAVSFYYKHKMNYIFRMQTPPNFEIDDYPKTTALKLQDDLISFANQTGVLNNKHTLLLNTRFKMNTTTFPVSVYPYLRKLFAQMISFQNEKVVLKKMQ